MNRIFILYKTGLTLFILFLTTNVSAQEPGRIAEGTGIHPLKYELEPYLELMPIEPRLPDMLKNISDESMEFNRQGYTAYQRQQYNEAVRLFTRAIELDPDNSFAFYNRASCYALAYRDNGLAEMDEPALAGDDLWKATGLDWYWGLMVMVDSDFDSLRTIDLGGITNLRPAPVDSAILHNFNSDGSVFLEIVYKDLSGMGHDSREPLGSGYYCVIGEIAFEYYPEIYHHYFFEENQNIIYSTPLDWFY